MQKGKSLQQEFSMLPGKRFSLHFPTVEEYNKVKGFAIGANEENMDRLADVLQKM